MARMLCWSSCPRPLGLLSILPHPALRSSDLWLRLGLVSGGLQQQAVTKGHSSCQVTSPYSHPFSGYSWSLHLTPVSVPCPSKYARTLEIHLLKLPNLSEPLVSCRDLDQYRDPFFPKLNYKCNTSRLN